MSLQKMIADIENERSHNNMLGETFQTRLSEIKRRLNEELETLAADFQAEVAARDEALVRIVAGDDANA